MKSLKKIYEKYAGPDGWGDKGTAHTYIDEYETLLKAYRNNSVVLEIGIAYGHSCEMWCDYFIDSTIIGVDIANHGIDIDNVHYKTIFVDASSPDILPHLENYTFDVIIDDGSHRIEDQLNSYNLLKHKLSPNGIYIIEDVANLDSVRPQFESLDSSKTISIIDNRDKKGRYDDVLVVIKK
jgi:cephalosporin hydroxylase